MKIRCKEIAKRIYLLKFNSNKELTKTFLRFQEYFESPKFKGKVFSLDEFKEWYIKNSSHGKKTGKFTYSIDWRGFNIPSKVLEPFYKEEFNPLSKEEITLLELFRRKRRKKFYIIAICRSPAVGTLQHEIAHGLFYTNPKYREKVINIVKRCDKKLRSQINKFLSKRGGGYHKDVWLDETHTHLITDMHYLKKHGVDTKNLLEISKELNTVFRDYFKQS